MGYFAHGARNAGFEIRGFAIFQGVRGANFGLSDKVVFILVLDAGNIAIVAQKRLLQFMDVSIHAARRDIFAQGDIRRRAHRR